MRDETVFPRPLSEREWELIEWVLPADRPGYRMYRNLLKELQVIGPGRWGEGNLVLGTPGEKPDTSGPMERIFANGTLETGEGTITISVHEYAAGQLEVQIACPGNEEIPDTTSVLRRVTYSTWQPGDACPFCEREIRSVFIRSDEPVAVLVFCTHNGMMWVHDAGSGVNHPIPHTNYYNELMLHKHIKDPSVALNSKNLFTMLGNYTDDDLRNAFIRYNAIWHRIDTG
jgi:hypothetical protein